MTTPEPPPTPVSMAPAAIFYVAAEYNPAKRMMGRQVASEAFLQTLARCDSADEFGVCAARRAELPAFRDAVQAEIEAVHAPLPAGGTLRVGALLDRIATSGRRRTVARGLTWLLKASLIEMARPLVAPDRPGGSMP